MPLPMRIWLPIARFLEPPEVCPPNRHLGRFSRVAQLTREPNWHTDTYDMCSKRLHLCTQLGFHGHHHGVDWWGWHGHYPSHICQRAFQFLELVHTQRTVGQAWSLCRFLYTLITHWPPVDLLKLPKQFPLLTLYPELGRRPSRHPSQLKST